MAGALVTINQAANPPGVPGVSREDLDLFGGANPILFTNDDDVGVVSWAWTLVDRPNGSAAALAGPATPAPTLNADVTGSYLVRLVTVDGSGNTYQDEIVAAVTLANGWRIPAAFETTQFHATRGWAEELDEILRDIAAGGPLFIPLQSAYDDGSAIVTTAAGGAVDLSRGATAAAADMLAYFHDEDAAPGRTQPLVYINDQNTVGVGTPPTFRILRNAAGLAAEFVGDVEVSGKLTVGGLIDPTGLVLDEQAAVPGGAPGAAKGTFWVKDDAPSAPYFTDDAGADHALAFVAAPVTLQDAYDAGEVITTDAPGAVELIRGVGAPVGSAILTMDDLNASAGRTAYMVLVNDQNVVGVGNTSTLRVQRTAVGWALDVLGDGLFDGDVRVASTVDVAATSRAVEFGHFRATPTDGDSLGRLEFWGNDDNVAPNETRYAYVEGVATDVSDTTEDGAIDFHVLLGAADTRIARLYASAAGGLVASSDMPAGAGNIGFDFVYTTNLAASDDAFRVRDSGATLFEVTGAGSAYFGGNAYFASGSAANPGLSFTSATTTGFYLAAGPVVGLSISGVEQASFEAGQLTITDTSDSASGAILRLYHVDPTPDADDVVGELQLHGRDDGLALKQFGGVKGIITVDTAGASRGGTRISSYIDGAESTYIQVNPGLVITDSSEMLLNVATAYIESLTTLILRDSAGAAWMANFTTNAATLTSYAAGATGQELQLYQDSASPAANDIPGSITFYGENNASAKVQYAGIRTRIDSVAAGAHDGALLVSVANAAGGVVDVLDVRRLQFLIVPGGTAAAPSIARQGGSNTGLYWAGDGVGLAAGGERCAIFGETADVAELYSNSATAVGFDLRLYQDSASPATDDVVGALSFYGEDSGGTKTLYADIRCKIDTITDPNEDGELSFRVVSGGTMDEILSMSKDLHSINIGGAPIHQVGAAAWGHYFHANFAGSSANRTTRALTSTLTTDQVLFTHTLSDTRMYTFYALVTGRKSDGAKFASYQIHCSAYRQGAGAVELGETADSSHETDSTWDAHWAANGNAMELLVHGNTSGAETVYWVAEIFYQSVSTDGAGGGGFDI